MRTFVPALTALVVMTACSDSDRAPRVAGPEGQDAAPSLEVVAAPAGFSEGFESGSFDAWDDGYDATRHRIITDASRAHSGSRALSITYPRGGDGGYLNKFFMPGVDSARVSYWVRFPATWRGSTFLFGLYASRIDDQWSGHGKGAACPTGRDFSTMFVVATAGTNPIARFSTTYPGMASSGGTCTGDQGGYLAVYLSPLTLRRGVWHKVELAVRLNTPGTNNGEQWLWINGVLRGKWHSLRFRDTDELRLNSFQLSAFVPNGSSQQQSLLVDDIAVSWASGSTLPPPPPPPSGPLPVASVTIVPPTASVAVGSTVQLAATTRDASGNVLTGRAIEWRSTGPALTVSGSGTITGVSAGSASVIATSEAKSDTAEVTVTAETPPPPPPAPTVDKIVVSPATVSLLVGASQQFTATATMSDGSTQPGDVVWSATGGTISTGGQYTAGTLGGTYEVRATQQGGTVTGTATVTLSVPLPPPPPPPPAAPSALAATAVSTSQVNVSWADNATTETGYEVERHAGNGLFTRVAQLGANVTSWSNTGLTAATTYSYRVRAINASGASGYSNTATATTQSPPPPPPPPSTPPAAGVLFKSDWRYTTGLTADAIQDGPSGSRKWGQWNDFNRLAPPNEILSVVASDGLGFPAGMTNVLRVRQRGGIDAEDVTATTLPAMAVGEHRYYRMYTRVDENASSGYDHQVQPQSGGCAYVWAFKRTIGSTTWRFQWQFSNTPSHQWYGLNGTLSKGQVYRVEWHIHRTGTTTFKFDTRVYNAAGTLIYDDDDFQNQDMVNGTLGSIDPNLNMPDFSCQTRLFVGNNGATGFTSGFTYYGGVEVRSDTWPGPYVP